jgi:hypothetical protein
MLKTKKEIEYWLYRNCIKNYVIHDNLTVDVMGNVNINNKNLNELPFQFGIVTGSFYCNNNNLTSLRGSPYEVTGDFNCMGNILHSLKDCPINIHKNFYCAYNPIKTLKGFKSNIGKSFFHSYDIDKKRLIKELTPYYKEESSEMRVAITGQEINVILLYEKLQKTINTNNTNIPKKLKI